MIDQRVTQAIVRVATGEITAVGYFPTPPDDPDLAVVDVRADQAGKLLELGAKTIDEDGVITVTTVPLPDVPPTPTQAEQVDQLVADGKAAIVAANITSPESQALAAIFAGALDGLGRIYGTAPPTEDAP